MKRLIVFLGIFCNALIPIASHSQVQLSDSTITLLKQGVEGFKNRYHSPSIVVAIVNDQNVIFSEALGYTDLEKKVPASLNSKYPILSISKIFTATMLMQLKQRGKINLHDDVIKYVPEFANPKLPGKEALTLFQLATHTSGLQRNSPADIGFTKQVDRWVLLGVSCESIEPPSKTQFLQSLKYITREYPDFQFTSYGDRRYSNLGYSLLGIAVERAAKIPYETFVKNELFKPIGMVNSGFDTEQPRSGNLAKGYWFADSSKQFIATPEFRSNSAVYAGGMYSTALDLAKFISFQLTDSLETHSILSPSNKSMMQSFGIGWRQSFPFVVHEGAMLGYRSQIAFNPEQKVGWVILTNTTDFDFSRINEYISRLLSPYLNNNPVKDSSVYTGVYRLEGGYDSLRIILKDGKLYSTYLDKELPPTPLVPSGNNKFKDPGKNNYNINYDFVANKKSEVVYLNMGQLKWVKQ